jgi:hypothetical protein
MSQADGKTTLDDWGMPLDFRLAIGDCEQLQEIINRPRVAMGMPPLGPTSMFRLMANADAWPHEVREVLRLGLIGAGMKTDRALVLIKRHVDPPGKFVQASAMACAVLGAALYGVPDDPVGKKKDETPPTANPEPPPMDLSGSRSSTGSGLQ